MDPPVIDIVWTSAFIPSLLKHRQNICLPIITHQFSEFALNVSSSPGVTKVQDHTGKNAKVGFNPGLVIHNTGFSANSTLMAICLTLALAQ